MVYTKEDCRFCKESKNILNRLGLDFVEITLTDETKPKLLERLENLGYTGTLPTTVPQFFRVMNDGMELYIGGGEDLVDDIFVSIP